MYPARPRIIMARRNWKPRTTANETGVRITCDSFAIVTGNRHNLVLFCRFCLLDHLKKSIGAQVDSIHKDTVRRQTGDYLNSKGVGVDRRFTDGIENEKSDGVGQSKPTIPSKQTRRNLISSSLKLRRLSFLSLAWRVLRRALKPAI